MEYKKIRYQNKSAVRLLLILLTAIIAVQCVSIALMWNFNAKYDKLYSEALEGQLILQREINLSDSEEDEEEPPSSEERETELKENEER